MKNWLARLFGAGEHPAPPVPTTQSVSTSVSVVIPPPSLDLDQAFLRLLAGTATHAGDTPERLILDELARLAPQPDAAAGLVPRVPAVLPQLLRSLRDEGMSGTDLARQVAQDVSLVAEVIREANSPYYRPAAPVRSIEGALLLLGQNGLRMLLARVAFRPVIGLQTGRLARQVAPQVWRQSEQCAAAAAMAAPALGADPFEACLAGLMQNVGLIVAFRLIDQVAPAAALPKSEDFVATLQEDARTLSARIAALWEFPPQVGQAILQAGQPDAAPLAQALHVAGRLSRLRLLLEADVAGAPELAAALPPAQRRIFDALHAKDE